MEIVKPGDHRAPSVEQLHVGRRLRTARERAGWSQRELAKRAQVTNSTISQVEQDQHSPSLTSLAKILAAFPLSISEFFALQIDESPFALYGPEKMTLMSRGKVETRLLAAERAGKRLQMFIEQYAPGGKTEEEMVPRQGELVGYVSQGEIALEIDGVLYRVGAGSGFQFFSSVSYRVVNFGAQPATVIWAVTPPMV